MPNIKLSTIRYLLRKKFAKCRHCTENARYADGKTTAFLCTEHARGFKDVSRLDYLGVIEELEAAIEAAEVKR